jgi:fructose-bisphosphate aldolase class II
MTTTYKDIGIVNTREMFRDALAGGYAIPAYNYTNHIQFQAILAACIETRSPVIFAITQIAWEDLQPITVEYFVRGAVKHAEALGVKIPMVLHLDHGSDFNICKKCVDAGFSSVMIDGSHLPYAENVALTKMVVNYAHPRDVTVEGELGLIGGIEGKTKSDKVQYTRPEEVEDFIKTTGADSLAIAIGTSHGANKFVLKPGESAPSLRFDILAEIGKRMPALPLVLHGASSVPQEAVAMVNQYGGRMTQAIGIPEEQLRKAVNMHVCKINVYSDAQVTMTGAIRKFFVENPALIDPRLYQKVARDALIAMYKRKNVEVLGSANRV